MSRCLLVALCLWTLCFANSAQAGGLDLPVVYGARYAGAGGASSAHADDASAILHNPAGLAHLPDGYTSSHSLSLFLVNLQTSPDFTNQNISTGTKLGPTLLGAGGLRVHDRVVVALGLYPVGAAGGEFRYTSTRGTGEVDWVNEQLALAFEISPGVGVSITDTLRVGLGYRMTALLFERVMGAADDPVDVNIDLFGFDFTGFRLGVQWQPLPALELGITYRHRVQLDASADEGALLGAELVDIESTMVVPSKLTMGGRLDTGKLEFMAEFDFIKNSQFDSIPIRGRLPEQDERVDVEFRFDWRDSFTAKAGVAYEIMPGFSLRQGYAFDSAATNAAFPTTFGAPPVDNHWLSAGAGYSARTWRLDVALLYRLPASYDLRASEIEEDCRFCAAAGRYRSNMTAIYVDYTHTLWGGPDAGLRR